MKKIYKTSFILLSILILSSCSGNKKLSKVQNTTKISKIPCGQFKNDKEYFRASASFTGPDLQFSRENSLRLTKATLAGLIASKIEVITDRYAAQRNLGNLAEFNQKVENYTRESISQELKEVNVICEEQATTNNGQFQIFTAVEVSKDVIYNGIDKGLSNDQKLRQDYDVMKFKEVFDEEMDKLEKEQP